MTGWRDPRLPKRWTDVRPGIGPRILVNRVIAAIDRLDASQRRLDGAIARRLREIEDRRSER